MTFDTAMILRDLGKAGKRLDEIHAVEAGAGNMSVAVDAVSEVSDFFPVAEHDVDLPLAVPSMAGYAVFVTGSGCRNREVLDAPQENVSAFVINPDGQTATWRYHPNRLFTRPTSEFNSHLAVHNDQVKNRGVKSHAVIHAQPPYLVQLSHEPEMAHDKAFNHAIFRWEPETIVQLPEGVKFLPFMVPGSDELMENNVLGLQQCQITIWAKHGLMVRSDISPLAAVDKIEYAETGAMYELRNRQAGAKGVGLSEAELSRVIKAFNVQTDMFIN